MLELMLCSLLTIVPDYLYRRYVQGKRLGKEITIFSVWFELRWGITACLILTVGLITTIFYNHPSTTNVTLFFRTVPILSETNGRVAEVYVGMSGRVEQGQPIFKLDSSKQEAAIETARRKIAEIEAELVVAQNRHFACRWAAFRRPRALTSRPWTSWRPSRSYKDAILVTFRPREIERLQVLLEGRLGSIAAATAAKQNAEERVSSLLPAQKASAEAALAQAPSRLGQIPLFVPV